MASRCASSAPSRAWRMPSSRGWAGSTATASSTRRGCSTASCASSRSRNIRFAGQITGCEGYVESAAIGLLAARFAAAELHGETLPAPPAETALGALLGHITGGADAETYQPMNVNFGLMPPIDGRREESRPEEGLHRPGASGPGGVARAAEGARARLVITRCVAARCWQLHVLCLGGGGAVVAYSAAVSQPLLVACRRPGTCRSSSPPIPRTTARRCRWCRAWRTPCAARPSNLLGLDLAVLVLVGAARSASPRGFWGSLRALRAAARDHAMHRPRAARARPEARALPRATATAGTRRSEQKAGRSPGEETCHRAPPSTAEIRRGTSLRIGATSVNYRGKRPDQPMPQAPRRPRA